MKTDYTSESGSKLDEMVKDQNSKNVINKCWLQHFLHISTLFKLKYLTNGVGQNIANHTIFEKTKNTDIMKSTHEK